MEQSSGAATLKSLKSDSFRFIQRRFDPPIPTGHSCFQGFSFLMRKAHQAGFSHADSLRDWLCEFFEP
jgi:hypothetical protein